MARRIVSYAIAGAATARGNVNTTAATIPAIPNAVLSNIFTLALPQKFVRIATKVYSLIGFCQYIRHGLTRSSPDQVRLTGRALPLRKRRCDIVLKARVFGGE